MFSTWVFWWQDCSFIIGCFFEFFSSLKRQLRGREDNSVLEISAQRPWVSNIRQYFKPVIGNDDVSVCARNFTPHHSPLLAKKEYEILKKGKDWTIFFACLDISCENRHWQLQCKTLRNMCTCHGSSKMAIINGCPVSQ